MSTFPAVAASLAPMRSALAQKVRAMGGLEPIVAAVVLAASEAAANAILHGYRGGDSEQALEVDAVRDGEAVAVTVADRGEGFGLRPGGAGLGLGLAIIAQLAEDFELRDRPGGGVVVWMRFPLDGLTI